MPAGFADGTDDGYTGGNLAVTGTLTVSGVVTGDGSGLTGVDAAALGGVAAAAYTTDAEAAATYATLSQLAGAVALNPGSAQSGSVSVTGGVTAGGAVQVGTTAAAAAAGNAGAIRYNAATGRLEYSDGTTWQPQLKRFSEVRSVVVAVAATFTHNLGTRDVVVSVYNDTTGVALAPLVSVLSNNAIAVTAASTGGIRVVVVG